MNQRAYFNITTHCDEDVELYIDVYWDEEIESSEKVLTDWGVIWGKALTHPDFITKEFLVQKMELIDYSI